MFKLQIDNHWTDNISDEYLVRREINRSYGMVAPNEQITPITYCWIMASTREGVADTKDLGIASFGYITWAFEALCCLSELELFGVGNAPAEFKSLWEHTIKPEGLLPKKYITHEKLMAFHRDFDRSKLEESLKALVKEHDHKMLFLSRQPWEVEERRDDEAPAWEKNKNQIVISARFIYKIIDRQNIV